MLVMITISVVTTSEQHFYTWLKAWDKLTRPVNVHKIVMSLSENLTKAELAAYTSIIACVL